MSKKIIAKDEEVVIGVDVSDKKHHMAVTRPCDGVILSDEIIESPGLQAWKKFLSRRLPGCRVKVVYEAGPHGYTLYDTILLLGHAAVVMAPEKHLGIKTNKRDARSIARDFLSGRARIVRVPSFEKRVQRQAARVRNMLVKDAKRTRSRINAMERFHGLAGTMKAVRNDDSGHLALCIEQLRDVLAFTRKKIKEMDTVLSAISRNEANRGDVAALTAITGIGAQSAIELTLGVADIDAFADSDAFASYLGLCPGEWSTGEARRLGHITKHGPGRLRGLLVQCAWSRVRHDPQTKQRFEDLKKRIGAKKAIVAIARRLAVQIFWALKAPRQKAAA